MCLIATSAVGCCLIWRISQPFTLLRRVLFVSIVAGLAIGILGFTEFFSIAPLSVLTASYVLAVSVASCALFFRLARAMRMRAVTSVEGSRRASAAACVSRGTVVAVDALPRQVLLLGVSGRTGRSAPSRTGVLRARVAGEWLARRMQRYATAFPRWARPMRVPRAPGVTMHLLRRLQMALPRNVQRASGSRSLLLESR